MKKLAIFFSILMLFLPIVFAETEIFRGKVITDTDELIDEEAFSFKYDATANKVYAQTPTIGLIVANGECKSNDAFRICINSANFSYRNSTTWVYYYELGITVYKLTGDLETTSKSTTIELLPQERTDFTIIINNPTVFDVTNVDYQEDLQPFTILDSKGCSLNESKLVWKGDLKSKYDKTCIATIVTDKAGTYTLKGTLSYFNYYETEKKDTDTLTITVLPRQLSVSRRSDEDVEVKQPFYINMSLKNTHETERIEAIATIDIPNNINVLKNTFSSSKENFLKRNLVLNTGDEFNYSLYLEAVSETKNPIKQTFDYTINDVRDVIENDTYTNPIEPKPIIDFNAESVNLTPGQKFIVAAKFRNPSKVHQLTNIKAKLTAPNNKEIEQTLDKLLPNESYYLISNTLIAPDIDLDSEFKLNLAVEYQFDNILRALNNSLLLYIRQKPPVEENVATSTTMPPVSQENQINQTTQQQTQLSNETTEPVITVDTIKSRFSGKDARHILTIIFVIIVGVPLFVYIIWKIYKTRKMKKELKVKEVLKDTQE